MEKRRPHYALAAIKTAFADPAGLNRSFVSKQGADDLDLDEFRLTLLTLHKAGVEDLIFRLRVRFCHSCRG